jgi:hypothetical protein
MGFHSAKHLSLLVLESEREMSFRLYCHCRIVPSAVFPVPRACSVQGGTWYVYVGVTE